MTLTIRREDCVEAVRGYLHSDDFTLEEYDVKTSQISGITGRYYVINASVLIHGRRKEIYFFAKTPPILKSQRVFVVEFNYFHRELVFYKYVVPEMIASLPPEVVLPLPRCTYVRDTIKSGFTPVPGSAEEELIVLEDLMHRGYVCRKSRILDLRHCEVALKAMARFHAASILLGRRKRSGPEDVSDSLGGGGLSFSDELWKLDREKAFVTRAAESTATAVCAMWPQRFSGQRDRILASMRGAWARFHAECRTDPKYVRAFIHGDAWGDNFMFYYEEDQGGNENPVEALLVDLQLVQYLPPIYDVIFFLHVSTRRSFRDDNMKKLLECYHKELSGSMPPGLCDIVLSFASLLESYEDLKVIGPLVSSSYLPKVLENFLSDRIRYVPEDVIKDLLSDRGERIAHNCEMSEDYRDWVEESFKECLEGIGLWE